jgi:hypothetical protein
MKFKIGDMVIGNKKANTYGITCEGWKGVVKSVDNKGKTISARGRGFGGCTFTFTDLDASCFDLYVENVREIVITTDGKKTTARLYNDKKCVKTATAKCTPDDEFDFEVGARIAFDRLVKKEEREIKKKDEFVPHLKCDRDHYGNIGEPTNYKDAIGRPLCVGDVVEHFNSENVSYGDTVIVKSNVRGGEKAFVMGIECRCNDKSGTIDGWKIIKKRSYDEVENGERIYSIKFVKEP